MMETWICLPACSFMAAGKHMFLSGKYKKMKEHSEVLLPHLSIICYDQSQISHPSCYYTKYNCYPSHI